MSEEFKGAKCCVMICPDEPDELDRAMGLRRQVKDELLTPEAALAWLEEQEYVNPRIRRWLERGIRG